MRELVLLVVGLLVACVVQSTSGCRDNSNICYKYKKVCTHSSYVYWTKVHCKKTCKFCPTTTQSNKCEDRKDYVARCKDYKRRDYCIPKYEISMKYYCRKTCGYCESPTDGQWSEWTPWTPCSAKCGPGKITRTRKCDNPAPQYGGAPCRGDAKEEDECQDRACSCSNTAKWDKTCPLWKKYCTRSEYSEFMRTNCKKTCNLCDGGQEKKKDQCRTGRCMHECNIVDGAVKCSCKKGWTLKKDGRRCERTCGRDKDVFIMGRVVGGVNAVVGKWIWQIGMYWDGEFVCGGSLITSEWFITAAHCVAKRKDPELMKIRLGDHDRNDPDEEGEEVRDVEKIIVHKEWNKDGTIANDIALIKLKKKATFSDTIGTVCLPENNIDAPKQAECYITGWGKTGIDEWEADFLQEARMPIVSNEECGKRNTNKQGKSRILKTMMCAGYNDTETIVSGCMGDSGGPFVCKTSEGFWNLQGVVSWGSNRCDVQHRYTVFTRVNKFIQWINQHMDNN